MKSFFTPFIMGITALYLVMLYFQCRAFLIEKLPEKKADATAKAIGITIAYLIFLAQQNKVEAANTIVNTQAAEQQGKIAALEARLAQCNDDGIKNRDFMVRLMDKSRGMLPLAKDSSRGAQQSGVRHDIARTGPHKKPKTKSPSSSKSLSKSQLHQDEKTALSVDTVAEASVGTVGRLILNKSGTVTGYNETHIVLRKGQRVVISAVGSISVGPLVGISGPDGRASGVLGFALTPYNIVKNYNHAALLCKVGENSAWRYCGGNCDFTAEQSGKLILNINDNDPSNNEGGYQVSIKVYE